MGFFIETNTHIIFQIIHCPATEYCSKMFWIVLFIVSLILFLSWMRSKYSYWEKRGVKGPTPIPLFGNIAKHVLGRCTMGQAIYDIYRKYEGYPFVGLYKSMKPTLLVRDPDFVSKILVKDFKSFRYNEFHLGEDSKSLFAQNPFLQQDEKWKQTRQVITPGMSSGKLKTMFAILQVINKNFVKYIENRPKATTEGIETRALTKRLTLDNVAKSAFGIDGKAFESYEDISEFNKMADSFLNPGTTMSLFFVALQCFPQISALIESALSRKAETQLKSIISDTINHRKTKNIRGTDYLQFLMDQGEQYNWSDHIITSHASTLFIDGYETSSLVLTYLLLNLAENPQYQQKIRDEIKKSEDENQGELTYDALHQLPWLNACVYESIRFTPPADIMSKICTESFEYTPTNSSFKNMTIRLSPGDIVILPYSFLMKDDKYFENADKFMPERMFTNTDKSIFFPFGDGPRACIGQRLGIMQVKLGAASVIKNFELSVSPKLQKPYKMIPYHSMNEIIGGFWIKYKKITN
nr:cytochrome P450 monooxygenase CYP347E7 [Euwallacea interjectus]